MFGLNDGMRYYVCQRNVRMNLGINGLYKLVSQEMDLPPLSGAVFIFFSKIPKKTQFSSGHMPVPNGQPCSIRWHAHADCKVLTSLNIYLMSSTKLQHCHQEHR